jgi:translation initiation factor 1
VTVIAGIDPVASDINALLARLKSACAAGGTINEGRIEIQGDHRERVVAILKELGYPARPTGG